jgi:hypothetical protein
MKKRAVFPPKPWIWFLLSCVALVFAQMACNLAGQPQVVVITATPEPTLPAVKETVIVQVVVTPTDSATDTSAPPPIASPAPPIASPTPPVLLVTKIEGPSSQIRARFISPDFFPAATSELWFQVQAFNPQVSDQDGAGIQNVEFHIFDQDGNEVYSRVEQNAAYCAFAGGEPDCNVFRFADTGYYWPETQNPVTSGDYTLVAVINDQEGNQWSGSIDFTIDLPNQ